jgi:hypothetical protein
MPAPLEQRGMGNVTVALITRVSLEYTSRTVSVRIVKLSLI